MKRRYIVAPQAARDLVDIWRYLRKENTEETADHVESVIREKFAYLADFPGGGHTRTDLTRARSAVFLGLFLLDCVSS
jgi:plasmid stabilization system protein ParE